MASRSKVGYTRKDSADRFLFSLLSNSIRYEKIASIARGLGLLDSEYETMVTEETQKKQIEKILDAWHLQLGPNLTVEQFVEEVSFWTQIGYLDCEVWKNLEHFVESDVLKSDHQNYDFASDVTPCENVLTSTNDEIHSDEFSPSLNNSSLGESGNYLSDFIKQQGDNPQLKLIELWNYSMPESKWAQLFQFTATCRYLSYIGLEHTRLDESGRYLAQSVTSLKELYLSCCSMPKVVWAEVLQSLSSCKQLIELSLDRNNIRDVGHYLTQSIRSWGDSPPLKVLYLNQCLMPEQVWVELLKSLSSCKHLCDLKLSDKTIGAAGYYLAQSITAWGEEQSLKYLHLSNCSIPKQVWFDLFPSLYKQQLSVLDLSGNTISVAGHHLAVLITSWGKNCPFESLHLSHCEIPQEVWPQLFEYLSFCNHLRVLDLSGNTLTGCLSHFLSDPNNPGLPSLKSLDLKCTGINERDLEHLTYLIQSKLSHLENVYLMEGSLSVMIRELQQLKKSCTAHPNGESILHIISDEPSLLEINQPSLDYTQEELDRAYNLACLKDTKKVFNARLNLVGHREAGKTSLATRLMGQELENTVSTEGVSMHLIKTTVKPDLLQGSKWCETSQNTSDLFKHFSHAVLLRVNQISTKEELTKSLKTEARELSTDDRTFHPQDMEISGKLLSKQIVEHLEKQPTLKISNNHKSNRKEKVQTEATVQNRTQTKRHIEEQGNQEMEEFTMTEGMRIKILTHEATLEEQQFCNEIPLSIRLWDLGGQNEFLTTHHLFLDAHSTTLIVMDITKPLHQMFEKNPKLGHPNTPAEVLHYWLNSLHVQSSEQNVKPSIALVLTHVDLLDAVDCQRFTESYICDILKTVDGKEYGYLLTQENIYIVNNTSENDEDFQKLRNQLICYLSQQVTWGIKMPVSWLKLKTDIMEKSQNRKHLEFSYVTHLAKQNRMTEKDVESFLNIENIQGDIIFKSSPELRNTVIIDPQWLVNRYSSLITHHRFLDEHNLTPTTYLSLMHGYVTKNGLEELWGKDQVEFLRNLMIKYNLIVPLVDKPETGQNYIIPSMLPVRNVNIHNLHPFKDMHIVYSAVQNPRVGDTLLVGTFHKLISDCSKTQNWKICAEDHLSYTDVSFEIRQEIRLTLTLMKHDQLRVTLWCSALAFEAHLSEMASIIEESRQILSSNMAKMNIALSDEFQALCPHSLASDKFPCLVRIRECMDPRNMTLCQRYLKLTCVVHRKKLQTSPSSLFLLAAEITGRRNQTILSTNSRVQQFAMTVHKGYKDYSVGVTDGRKTIVRSGRESSLNIQIAEGVKSVIMMHIHSDFDSIRKSTPKDECLISPVVHLHAHNVCEEKDSVEYRYKAIIPHYLPAGYSLSCVKVRCGDIQMGSLREIRREKPQDRTVPYYDVDANHVTLYSNHFCDVVCTSTDKVCTSKVMAFPFGWIGQQKVGIGAITRMKMKTYITSYLYSDKDLQTKLRNKAATFGYEVLDELTIPFDQEDPDVEKSAVTIGLTVDGPVAWQPTKIKRKTWDPSSKEMLQKSKLPGVLTISNGHLCKSEPFDAANFGMKTESAESAFYGNVEVTLHVPDMEDQSRDVDVTIPPVKVQELKAFGPKEETRLDKDTTVQAGMATPGNKQILATNEHVEPGPSIDREGPPLKRSRKDSLSNKSLEVCSPDSPILTQQPPRGPSAENGSSPRQNNVVSEQSSVDNSAVAQPGCSGFLSPTATVDGIQDTAGRQLRTSAIVPYTMQSFGLEDKDLNNDQHFPVTRQGYEAMRQYIDNRPYFTVANQRTSWMLGPLSAMRLGQQTPRDNLPLPELQEPPETPVDLQQPWGHKLLNEVARFVISEDELMQLGLSLDVDKYFIQRMISDKGFSQTTTFNVLCRFNEASLQEESEKRHKLRKALCYLGKGGLIVQLGI